MNNHYMRYAIKWNDICIFISSIYIISIFILSDSTEFVIYSEMIFFLLVASTVLKILMEHKIPTSKLYFFLAAFILWCALSTFWTEDIQHHIDRLKTIFQLALLCIIYFIIYSEEGALDKFIRAYLFAGYLMCFYAIYVYGGWSSFIAIMSSERLGTEINQANLFGYYAALTVCFSFYLAYYKGRRGFYILMGLPFIMALSSGSKRALILVLMGILLLGYLKNRSKKLGRTIIYVSVVAFCLYCTLQLPIFLVVNNRMESLFNYFGGKGYVDTSTIIREGLIEYGWNLFLERPFIGYGLNAFTYITQFTYSHNNYIEMLVNGGVIGFTLYYIIVLTPFSKLLRSTLKFDSLSTLFFVLLCIGFVNDIGAVTYYGKLQYIIIGVCFACVRLNAARRLINDK